MKTQALKHFRAKLANNEPVYGLWVTLESASITEMAVALGLDWVVIDAEHGHLDWKDINEHIRAGLRSDTVVLVRLAERSTSLTKRALDIGAASGITRQDDLCDRKHTCLVVSEENIERVVVLASHVQIHAVAAQGDV